ncbi:MAG: DUF2437 domain-containing protein, partial [Pirellulaceae bacterium]|nr:DUF2437 domain-containing protein [Pirellulaceae bacterium]
MRLCRFKQADGHVGWGLYTSDTILSLDQHVPQIFPGRLGHELARSWEASLPIGGQTWTSLWKVMTDVAQSDQLASGCQRLPVERVKLLPPLASPPTLLLLAGNYAEHVREQGGTSAEKAATFPYVF